MFDIWSHQNYFVYVLEGKKKWVTMQSDYLVREGEAIFVKKGANIIHKIFEKDFCALIILLSDDFIKTVVEHHPIPDSPEGQLLEDSVSPLYLNIRLARIKAKYDPENFFRLNHNIQPKATH